MGAAPKRAFPGGKPSAKPCLQWPWKKRASGWGACASAASLVPFAPESIKPGSTVHTDGWLGYEPLTKKGYQHPIVFLSGRRKQASELLPRVPKAISLLKRWLLGTRPGAISRKHLDDYRDEFVFRFNRRSSRRRGKLFYRLVQQAVAVEPTPYSLDRRRLMLKRREPNDKILGLPE